MKLEGLKRESFKAFWPSGFPAFKAKSYQLRAVCLTPDT
jgi:hypothetical protein